MAQPLFTENRIEVLHDLITQQPLGALVTSVSGQISANHLPFIIHPDMSEQGTLRAHIHRGNALWQERDSLQDALVIFQGPQAYITPSWYPSKIEHGKTVPTWNYVVVHARGALKFTTDTKWLLEHLSELTSQNESHRNDPWKLDDAPEDYIQRQLRGIVGIEMPIESLVGTWKVSQNRSEEDKQGVADGLAVEENIAARLMSNLVAER